MAQHDTEPVRITSRDNPLLVALRKLARDPAGYRRGRTVWLEGEHLCSAAAARGIAAAQALVAASSWDAGDASLQALARHASRVAVVADELFKGLSSLESPGRIGFLVEHAQAAPLQPGVDTVVLDRLQDAGNVGTILRTAAALGISQVVALKGTAALWSPKVLRAGMGAHFGLHLAEGLGAADLDALGVPLLAASSHAEQALHEMALPKPCAFVFGHEGQGVDPELMGRCQATVRIPQPGGEESLNVASAAAICLYELVRQRTAH